MSILQLSTDEVAEIQKQVEKECKEYAFTPIAESIPRLLTTSLFDGMLDLTGPNKDRFTDESNVADENGRLVTSALMTNWLPCQRIIGIIKDVVDRPLSTLVMWGDVCFNIWDKCGAFKNSSRWKHAFRKRAWLNKAFMEYGAYTGWEHTDNLRCNKGLRMRVEKKIADTVVDMNEQYEAAKKQCAKAVTRRFTDKTKRKHIDWATSLRVQIEERLKKVYRFKELCKYAEVSETEEIDKPFADKASLEKLSAYMNEMLNKNSII